MNRRLFLTFKAALLTAFISSSVFAQTTTETQAEVASKTPAKAPQVLIETTEGTIVLELYPDKAPKTVENFLTYVNEEFYDNTIFHRVIPGFMVQGGGFTEDFEKKITHAPIQNEADNGLRNRIGTVAMARTNDPHSATAQFFINVAQNTFLDFREKTPRAWGYAVFGKVISGMKTVNKIRMVRTGFKNGMKDVPIKTVKIIKARQIK
ncbi:peptidyl-prolyl cis-trans isomerase [Thiomicrorhabdus immobilis]|uniref:Peptidyl-prolyl cis-trans isomerase n=1 Tax=Thiomicrorhabdus immobilis TaxID=2791037 RepID=A0ABM7MDR8_9GAMM|nr:peptidylprolyl isomerase [Thiomicrorhabdus immobilis]BCN93577.1 peptidyl-prolyl cis-trans isomerase [Thiomicrorhabdus immobilis]